MRGNFLWTSEKSSFTEKQAHKEGHLSFSLILSHLDVTPSNVSAILATSLKRQPKLRIKLNKSNGKEAEQNLTFYAWRCSASALIVLEISSGLSVTSSYPNLECRHRCTLARYADIWYAEIQVLSALGWPRGTREPESQACYLRPQATLAFIPENLQLFSMHIMTLKFQGR